MTVSVYILFLMEKVGIKLKLNYFLFCFSLVDELCPMQHLRHPVPPADQKEGWYHCKCQSDHRRTVTLTVLSFLFSGDAEV